MKIEQRTWTHAGWSAAASVTKDEPQLVLLFGGTEVLARGAWMDEVRRSYPRARLVGCSTAGEIAGMRVLDESVVATAVHFEHTRIQVAQTRVDGAEQSCTAGEELAASLHGEGLVHVFVLSDGQRVNGSDLVRGLTGKLPSNVRVTGGLAGDGDRFARTLVFAGEVPREGVIAAVGFYGSRLRVGYGSLGGWDPFGPERIITRSAGNILFELDGKPALDLYKTYLGEHAAGLPATGLLFPLNLRRQREKDTLVRTILSVDEASKSLTFAGDVPQGARAQLMKANFERLIDGAAGAASASHVALGRQTPDLAILISCVGRKLVLRQRTEEEVESVANVLGKGATLAGFYSYGEISPAAPNAACDLHNQTMTITTLKEA